MNPDIRHGIDGWYLEDMDWDPATGISTFEYVHLTTKHKIFVPREQPCIPIHKGWETRDRDQGIFELGRLFYSEEPDYQEDHGY